MAKHISLVNIEKVETKQEAKQLPIYIYKANNEKSNVIAKKTISATKISRKIHMLASYKEGIPDLMHSQRYKKAIKEEI